MKQEDLFSGIKTFRTEKEEIEKHTFLLSTSGKNMLWKDWHEYDYRFRLSDKSFRSVSKRLGPPYLWEKNNLTLGDIAKISKKAEREFAYFFITFFSRFDLVEMEHTMQCPITQRRIMGIQNGPIGKCTCK